MAFFKKYIHFKFLSKIKPERVAFKNNNAKIIKGTGTSNMTHISNTGNNLKMGENVFIGHFNYIDSYNANITICNNVQITNFVSILTHSTHNNIRFKNASLNEEVNGHGDVYIGSHTYIGPHSVIMPNTTVGKACIISAYSYVKGNVPDYSIVRGQPAKIIGDTREIDSKIISKYPNLEKHFLE